MLIKVLKTCFILAEGPGLLSRPPLEGVDDRWLLELLLVGSEGKEQVERGDRTLLLCFSSANCQ